MRYAAVLSYVDIPAAMAGNPLYSQGRNADAVRWCSDGDRGSVAAIFTWEGWFMTPLPGWVILYGISICFGFVLDAVKVAMMPGLPIDGRRGG